MSKTRIIALAIIAAMLAAFFTNPSAAQHESKIRAKAIELLKQHAGTKNSSVVDFGVQLFGNTLIDQFMKNHIVVKNYYLFSVAKVRWERDEQILGVGAFGNVWLSSKIDEKASEIVEMIKAK
ncbi:DUF4359 domain-containing protein [Sphingobacterium griseoflavum]|uniref:DUF4359 domain-containing protein n=1 Tax=Sphingobacterium griseoflavum TaxID=1474952 RepID=A0ABQ3HT63_9SPHI|nr:DUF4359 domain-containing protein [Sphingobacterium griseoflavum]GHE29270.1 hypothetical protein GCM10017764_10020 [Sphingobacterium griseoflavum]